MSRIKLASVVAGLSLFAAAPVLAQETVTLTQANAPGGAPVIAFGYYMSPYAGTVNGTTQRLNCVDFFHEVMQNDTWQALQTNLGAAMSDLSLLGNTRDGSNGYYSSLNDVLTVYQRVAWLTDQYPPNPGASAATQTLATAIQTAIWAIASNQPGHVFLSEAVAANNYYVGTTSLASVDPNSTGYWINQANVQYGLQSADYYGKFNILTDVNSTLTGGRQEFIYSTPEPGTLVLLGTGFAALVGRTRRRRNGGMNDLVPDASVV